MKTLNDLTAPAEVTKRLLEKDVQKQCVDWARARGYWARKFSSQSQRSVPDYLFAKRIARGVATEHLAPVVEDLKFATEFKRPGGEPTEAQMDEMNAMKDAGWHVFSCDSVDYFKKMVFKVEAIYGVS